MPMPDRTIKQIILSCKDELRSADSLKENGHPDEAKKHLYNISDILKHRLPPQAPQPTQDAQPTTDTRKESNHEC